MLRLENSIRMLRIDNSISLKRLDNSNPMLRLDNSIPLTTLDDSIFPHLWAGDDWLLVPLAGVAEAYKAAQGEHWK